MKLLNLFRKKLSKLVLKESTNVEKATIIIYTIYNETYRLIVHGAAFRDANYELDVSRASSFWRSFIESSRFIEVLHDGKLIILPITQVRHFRLEKIEDHIVEV